VTSENKFGRRNARRELRRRGNWDCVFLLCYCNFRPVRRIERGGDWIGMSMLEGWGPPVYISVSGGAEAAGKYRVMVI
jgi:hypothetical protein